VSKHFANCFFGALYICAVTSAMAQINSANTTPPSQPSDQLETVTVTARKVSESLQDVPVAVFAITKMQLNNNLASSLENIAELAPLVSIGKETTGTGALITIRGISSAATDAGLDQSVTMDIDGVALSRGRIVQAATFDLASVQILEGPQALFFGKNSPAGVIVINSADPTNSYESSAKVGHEFNAEETYGEAFVSGPINDTLKARVAVRYDYTLGWIDNNSPAEANPFQPFAPLPGSADGSDRLPTSHDTSGRISLFWDPVEDFSAKLKVTLNRETTNSNAGFTNTLCTNGQNHIIILGVVATHSDCAGNEREAISNLPPVLAVNYPYGNDGVPFTESNLGIGSLILNKTLGDISVTSTTGYYSQTHQGTFIGDFSEFAQIFDAESERFHQVNEELRANTTFASSVNGMLGAYYESAHRYWFNAPDLLNLFNSVANNYQSFSQFSNSDNSNYSAFGQLRWKIIPTLELAGGARYSHDSKTTDYVNEGNNPYNPSLGIYLRPDGLVLPAQYSGNNTSPEVTLAWKPEPNQTLYAAYKTGYKAGGLSNGALLTATATAESLTFGPEKTHGFEAGYKSDLLSNTLRLDVIGYDYDYNGLQVTTLVPPTFSPAIENAAKARTYGVEVSAQWIATYHLSFNGDAAFNHARYLSFPNSECYFGQTLATGCVNNVQNLYGKPLQRAPNAGFRVGTDYKIDLPGRATADFSLSGAYTSSYLTAADYSPGGPQSGYWLLNSALRLSPQNDKYEVAVIGRNLTNSFVKLDTHTIDFGTPYQYYATYNRPREIVLQFQYNFF